MIWVIVACIVALAVGGWAIKPDIDKDRSDWSRQDEEENRDVHSLDGR